MSDIEIEDFINDTLLKKPSQETSTKSDEDVEDFEDDDQDPLDFPDQEVENDAPEKMEGSSLLRGGRSPVAESEVIRKVLSDEMFKTNRIRAEERLWAVVQKETANSKLAYNREKDFSDGSDCLMRGAKYIYELCKAGNYIEDDDGIHRKMTDEEQALANAEVTSSPCVWASLAPKSALKPAFGQKLGKRPRWPPPEHQQTPTI